MLASVHCALVPVKYTYVVVVADYMQLMLLLLLLLLLLQLFNSDDSIVMFFAVADRLSEKVVPGYHAELSVQQAMSNLNDSVNNGTVKIVFDKLVTHIIT